MKPYLLNLGAENQKATAGTGSSVQRKDAHFGAIRATPVLPQKLGICRVSMAITEEPRVEFQCVASS